MWESNMALAFNFPDHNELQVEKKVDVSGVNKLFQSSFLNQKIFTFNIQNLATHYGTTPAYTPRIDTKTLPDTAYSKATGLLSYVPSPPDGADTDKAVLWSSDKVDPTSANRAERRGTLAWDTAIDIRQYSYLTFDVYVKGELERDLRPEQPVCGTLGRHRQQANGLPWHQGAAKQRCLRRGDRAAPGNVVHRTADVELPAKRSRVSTISLQK